MIFSGAASPGCIDHEVGIEARFPSIAFIAENNALDLLVAPQDAMRADTR
jgi:hypothetical protein